VIPQLPIDEVVGLARIDRRTKRLIPRLQHGDVAVIDHLDLDRIAAEGLVEARPAAVINASPSISGRYANLGPLLIAAAGIPLIDDVGHDVMDAVSDGQLLRIEGDRVLFGDRVVAKGTRQSMASLETRIEAAKAAIGDELERFAENTLAFIRRERHLFTDAPDMPALRTNMNGRDVLVVVRGHDYEADLAALRAYVTEVRPVLVGVDGGADALCRAGLKPDLIIGDFDSVSDAALKSGAELVVHAYPGGHAPGAARLQALQMEHVMFEAGGTSEDVALLLAYEQGAELIVAVGAHASMNEFLDKGRAGMASTFLTRLKVGPILIDAKGVNRLYRSRIRKRDLLMLVAAALFAVIVMVAVSEPTRLFLRTLFL
jgi:uncharacterized membrane-anchored protein